MTDEHDPDGVDIDNNFEDDGSIDVPKAKENWREQLRNLLFNIFGKNEIEPGKFAIMPGKHYEVFVPLEEFINGLRDEAYERGFTDGEANERINSQEDVATMDI